MRWRGPHLQSVHAMGVYVYGRSQVLPQACRPGAGRCDTAWQEYQFLHRSLRRRSALQDRRRSLSVYIERSSKSAISSQLSHDLCRVLRHKIGNCRGSAFRCDEGGWVDIDAVISDRNNDIFPPTTSKARRYMAIMEVIKWQESGYKKSRFQILAARFPSVMNPNDTKAAGQVELHGPGSG